MKYILLLLLSFPVSAQEWTTEDTQWEAGYLALHLIDWGQTLDIAENSQYTELNPLIGSNPSRGDVNRYFAVTAIGHYLISRYLGENRRLWQQTTMFIEFNVVARNASIGVNINF